MKEGSRLTKQRHDMEQGFGDLIYLFLSLKNVFDENLFLIWKISTTVFMPQANLPQQCSNFFSVLEQFTLPKTNMDTQNDGLEKVNPFENFNFWYLCWISGV